MDRPGFTPSGGVAGRAGRVGQASRGTCTSVGDDADFDALKDMLDAFDGVVVLPIGESTARGLSEGALRHEDTNPYHFHDAGRLFVLEMLLNAFAIAA